jgi:hypothetical protein
MFNQQLSIKYTQTGVADLARLTFLLPPEEDEYDVLMTHHNPTNRTANLLPHGILGEPWATFQKTELELPDALGMRATPASNTQQSADTNALSGRPGRRFTRAAVYQRLIDDLLDVFGGSAEPVMEHLVESGKLSLADIRAAEKALARLQKAEKPT